MRAERDEDILYRQWPALRPVTNQTDPAVLGILATTREERNAVATDIDDRRVQREKDQAPKMVEDKWPDYTNCLLKLCHVNNLDNLPEFWKRAAAWKKGDGTTFQGLLQIAVKTAAIELDMTQAPVTVRQANKVQNWMFARPTNYTLTRGVGPFTVTPPGAVSHEALAQLIANFENISDHTTMMEGQHVPVHNGIISTSSKAVRADTVSNAICSVGQMFLWIGTHDPRLSLFTGKINFRIARMVTGWTKDDLPPSRVQPCPIILVDFLLNLAYSTDNTNPAKVAHADMIYLTFFLLLRPGRYTRTTNDDAAFTLSNVWLHIGQCHLNLVTAPIRELEAATWISLYFTTRKNQWKGGSISLGRTLNRWCCPVQSAV